MASVRSSSSGPPLVQFMQCVAEFVPHADPRPFSGHILLSHTTVVGLRRGKRNSLGDFGLHALVEPVRLAGASGLQREWSCLMSFFDCKTVCLSLNKLSLYVFT